MRLAAACLALAALAAAAAANVLVVRSNHPAYPVGRPLPDNARIPLGPGESVTVVGRGGTRIFRGPGTYSPSDPIRPAPRDDAQRPDSGRLGGISMSALERGRAPPPGMVIRASGPSARSYPPGRRLPADAPLALGAGDVVVVLVATGTRTFRGPGNFRLSDASRAVTSTRRRGRVLGSFAGGVVFDGGSGFAPRPPTIWHIDTRLSGNVCLAPGAAPTLWRAESGSERTLTITGPQGASRSLPWPAGQPTLAWPADLPLTDGAEYSLGHPGLAAPVRIRLRRLANAPADLTGVAEALVANDCRGQLDQLAQSAPEAAESPVAEAPPAPDPPAIPVEISRDQVICLAPGARVALSRPEDVDLFLEIRGARGAGAIMDWVRGVATLPWPPNLPLADRARYALRRMDGAAPAGSVVFRTLPPGATGAQGDDPVAVANALIARGCQGQLDRLIDATLVREADPPG